MKKHIPSLVFFLALAGCAGDSLERSLPLLSGQPIGRAVGYLGPASITQSGAGQTVYIWNNEQTGTYSVPSSVATPGITMNSGTPLVTYSRSDIPYSEETYIWKCRLEITADGKGLITGSHYSGDTGGCQKFSKALQPLVDAAGEAK